MTTHIPPPDARGAKCETCGAVVLQHQVRCQCQTK